MPSVCSVGGALGRASAPHTLSAGRAVRPHGGTRRASRLRARADGTSPSLSTSNLKTDLQRLVANTKRGKQASPEQRRAILQAIAALEAECGVADPVESAWLSGSWALLYNGAASVEDDDAWRRSSGEVEGPFLSFFKPLTRNLVSTRGDTQLIDVPGGRVENVAEFRIFNSLDGSLNIRGVCSATPPEETGGRRVRLDVEFTDFVLSLGSWSTTVSLSRVRPQGWVQTTYLDEDFRIGRGDKGSVFVTARRKASADAQ